MKRGPKDNRATSKRQSPNENNTKGDRDGAQIAKKRRNQVEILSTMKMKMIETMSQTQFQSSLIKENIKKQK